MPDREFRRVPLRRFHLQLRRRSHRVGGRARLLLLSGGTIVAEGLRRRSTGEVLTKAPATVPLLGVGLGHGACWPDRTHRQLYDGGDSPAPSLRQAARKPTTGRAAGHGAPALGDRFEFFLAFGPLPPKIDANSAAALFCFPPPTHDEPREALFLCAAADRADETGFVELTPADRRVQRSATVCWPPPAQEPSPLAMLARPPVTGANGPLMVLARPARMPPKLVNVCSSPRIRSWEPVCA